ncbi:MAG: hypothetical protein LBU55_02345 [Elusimicrobiota bacterium]|jgi:phosphopantothenoylcysteine decarboxylase/phosphopantothenate--cysteine ligase|nr:hypothetical protein [Elusimicrobiota bacterium]
MSVIQNKNIILGVCGGIAAYKVCGLIRTLVKLGANVECVLTENAKKFVTPLTLQTLSKNRVYADMFESIDRWEIEHISLAKKADIIVVVPATAEIISSLACGRADNLVSSLILASKSKILICPAMNSNMFSHKSVQNNIEILKSYSYQICGPQKGELACSETGCGRLADIETITDKIESLLN